MTDRQRLIGQAMPFAEQHKIGGSQLIRVDGFKLGMHIIFWEYGKEILAPKLKAVQTIDRIRQRNNSRINMTVTHLL